MWEVDWASKERRKEAWIWNRKRTKKYLRNGKDIKVRRIEIGQ